MYFTSGSDRAFEQLMQGKPGFDHYDSGEAVTPEDCGTCRFYRPHWKYQFCVYAECPYQPGKLTAYDAVTFRVKGVENMAVFRVERNKGYTVMSNHHLRNKDLSLKAKGLLSQMLSLPENWDYTAIRNVFNEMYAKDTSKKIRATWQSKGRSGEHLTTIPPYGYKKDPEDKKRWIVDEEAAAIVQKIFALCMDGLGPTQITKWLQKNKVLNPTAYAYDKGLPVSNKPPVNPYKWTNETVSRILERLDYLGHTVNFKTTKQSFKSKKVLWNDPADWVIFENTQEPIIEESVFLIVQKIRQGRRRPTKMGDMGMFSGLLYCADCGGKMYLCRTNYFKPEQEYYICSTYRKDRTLCTTHSIRRVVLEEIVLRNLREAIQYVTQYEDDFVQRAADQSLRERDKELAQKKDTLTQSQKRIAELDVIIKRLYEDNISGKLSDERFIKLSRDYELEQTNLTNLVEHLRKEVKEQEKQKVNVRQFIAAVRKYTDMQQLDASVLREFVEKIYISEVYTPDENEPRIKVREIEIVYNFIGAFDFEEAREQSQAAQKEKKTGVA